MLFSFSCCESSGWDLDSHDDTGGLLYRKSVTFAFSRTTGYMPLPSQSHSGEYFVISFSFPKSSLEKRGQGPGRCLRLSGLCPPPPDPAPEVFQSPLPAVSDLFINLTCGWRDQYIGVCRFSSAMFVLMVQSEV